jgi:hypothetical protein
MRMPDRKRMQLENVAVHFVPEQWGIPDSFFVIYQNYIPISKALLICLGPRQGDEVSEWQGTRI